jgi:hypothetical protein
MRLTTVAFGVLAAATLAGAVGLAAWAGASVPGLVLDAGPFTKLLDAVLIAALGGLYLLRKASVRRDAPDLLRLAAWALPLLGLLAALWGWYLVFQAVQATGASDPRVIAPSVAESLVPLGLGLLGGALAQALHGRRLH